MRKHSPPIPSRVQQHARIAAMRDEPSYSPPLKPYVVSVRVPSEIRSLIRQRLKEEGYSSESRYFLSLAIFDLVTRCRHWLTPDIDNQDTLDSLVAAIVRDFPRSERGKHSEWVRHRIYEALNDTPPDAKAPL